MRCVTCGDENKEDARACATCGASLRVAHVQFHLDQAESSTISSNFEQATKRLAAADLEMTSLSLAQRSQHFFSARAFWIQGRIYFGKGMLNEAAAEMLLAESELREHPLGSRLLAQVLNGLGTISYYQNLTDEASGYFRRSSSLALAVGEHAVAAKAFNNLGNICLNTGEVEKAIDFYTQGLEQAELDDAPSALADNYRTLALLYASYGPYSLALRYAANALALRERIENLDMRCLITAEAASVYVRHDDLAEAEVYLREALKLVGQSGNLIVEEAVALHFGDLMWRKGDNHAWLIGTIKTISDASSKVFLKGPSAVQLAAYYIAQADWAKVSRHLHWIRNHAIEGVELQELPLFHLAQAMIYSALEQWAEAEEQFKLALSDHTLPPYNQANTLAEYARMMFRYSAASPDSPERQAEAIALAQRAAHIFHELELPKRATAVEMLLAAG